MPIPKKVDMLSEQERQKVLHKNYPLIRKVSFPTNDSAWQIITGTCSEVVCNASSPLL